MTIDAMHQARQGLQTNQRRFERAAGDVTRATTAEGSDAATPDLHDATVDLLAARRGFEACLAVAEAADEMIGTLIDTLA